MGLLKKDDIIQYKIEVGGVKLGAIDVKWEGKDLAKIHYFENSVFIILFKKRTAKRFDIIINRVMVNHDDNEIKHFKDNAANITFDNAENLTKIGLGSKDVLKFTKDDKYTYILDTAEENNMVVPSSTPYGFKFLISSKKMPTSGFKEVIDTKKYFILHKEENVMVGGVNLALGAEEKSGMMSWCC